jgi:hypothetical protein
MSIASDRTPFWSSQADTTRPTENALRGPRWSFLPTAANRGYATPPFSGGQAPNGALASSLHDPQQVQYHDDHEYDQQYVDHRVQRHIGSLLTTFAGNLLCRSGEQLPDQHHQQNYHQYGDHQVQRPAPHPISPRSLSFGRRLGRNIYPLGPRRNEKGYKEAAPRTGRRLAKVLARETLTSCRPCRLASRASPPRARPPRRLW